MWRENTKKKIEKMKNSIFFVNKLYLVILFLLMAVTDGTLAFYSFLSYVFIYLWNVLTARLPIDNKGKYEYVTRIYKSVEDIELKVDIWYPNHYKETYPLVVFAHGGGWISGFRNQPNNISWCKYLAANGFAVASIDYRFGIKNDMQDILSDYDHALGYLRDHAIELKLCPKKIVLMGLSAGGHLSLLYSAYYSYKRDNNRLKGICGVVAYYSPSDLSDLLSSESRSLFARFATIATLKEKSERSLKKTYKATRMKPDMKFKKNAGQEQELNLQYYSPINWISKRMLPVLMVHGKNDSVVPFSSSVKLAGKLKKSGVLYKLLVHPKGDHCFEVNSKDLHTIKILRTTIKWINALINES